MDQRHIIRRTGGSAGRRLWSVAVGLAGALVLGACSDGTDVGSAVPQRATTSTSRPQTSASVPQPTPSTPTTPTKAAPVADATEPTTRPTIVPPAEPTVVASPRRAARNTQVDITGDGFTDEHWRASGVTLWLAGGPSGCDFYADADHDVRVDADGHLSGWFVVPDHGNCRQSTVDGVPVAAGHYRIVYQCTACTIGEFEVTEDAAPPVGYCHKVEFSPASNNLAVDIRAYGVPCEEAEAVVREVGGPLGPINGDPQGEARGFTCVRIAEDETYLPSATYECTRGGERITFVRT